MLSASCGKLPAVTGDEMPRDAPRRSDAGTLRRLAFAAAGALSLSACASVQPPALHAGADGAARPRAYNRPYQVRGRWYSPQEQPGYDAVGIASWYSYESPSRTTSDGEPLDARLATAAHRTLPIPSYLDVTNLDNGRRVRVRLNDRGPFAAGRILDVSRAAAEQLGFLAQGTARVRVRYAGPAPPLDGSAMTLARTQPRLSAARWEDPAPAGSGMDAASRADARFGVQAAAFSDLDHAERAAARLAGAGPAVVRQLDQHGLRLYRVLVGPLTDETAAAFARDRVARLGFPDAHIVAGF